MTGRWNTIAWRRRRLAGSASLQRTPPAVGRSRPCIRRISTLLPAPLAPRITVLGPASIESDTPAMIRWPLLAYATLSSVSGRIEELIRALSEAPLRRFLHELGAGVQHQHDGDQHEAQAQRERQIALRRFQRDGGGHDARHAVDVAADD